MGLLNYYSGKTNDGLDKMIITHYYGLPNIPFKFICDMIINPDKNALEFKDTLRKETRAVVLPFNKIIGSRNVPVKEIIEQRVYGKTIAGDLFIRDAVAVIRNMDSKELKKTPYLYIINYVSAGDVKSIILKEIGNLNYKKFQKSLKEYLPKIEKDTEDIVL